MKRTLSLSGLVLVTAVFAGTAGTSSRPPTAGVSHQGSLTTTGNQSVSFGGVSFTCDSSLAERIETQTVAAHPHDKPSDVVPEHPSFRLIGYARGRDYSRQGDPEIKVFSLIKFREAVAMASAEGNQGVNKP